PSAPAGPRATRPRPVESCLFCGCFEYPISLELLRCVRLGGTRDALPTLVLLDDRRLSRGRRRMRSLGSGFDCLQASALWRARPKAESTKIGASGHCLCSAAALTPLPDRARPPGPVGATRSPDGASL